MKHCPHERNMKTTATLDPEVAEKLHSYDHRKGLSLKKTLHELILRGLSATVKPERFQVEPHRGGVRPGYWIQTDSINSSTNGKSETLCARPAILSDRSGRQPAGLYLQCRRRLCSLPRLALAQFPRKERVATPTCAAMPRLRPAIRRPPGDEPPGSYRPCLRAAWAPCR